MLNRLFNQLRIHMKRRIVVLMSFIFALSIGQISAEKAFSSEIVDLIQKEVQIISLKTKGSPADIQGLFAKDDRVLHIIIEGELIVLYTELETSATDIMATISQNIKEDTLFIGTSTGVRNPKLFKK